MRNILIVSAVALVMACSDAVNPPTPPSYEGTYVATAANGQPLPALLVEAPTGNTGQVIKVYLVYDTLTLEAGGLYRQRAQLEGRLEGQVLGRQVWSDHGRFVRDGETSTFESEYLENVAFTANRGTDGRLQVTQDLTTEAAPALYVFNRLDQP